MQQIRGKKALVTGAAAGIGRAIALALAREGVDLYLLDIDEAGLKEVVADAGQYGVQAIGTRCDVADPGDITASAEELLARWGSLDILVNNAGIAYYGPMLHMNDKQWERLLAINLHAPIQFTRELLPTLLDQDEAHVLNVSSICGLVAGGRLCAYHTSKFGLTGFSEALRAEFGRRGLGVSTLCPGLVNTGIFKTAVSDRRDKPAPTAPAWLCSTPERVAAKAIRAIRRDRPLVLVSPFAYALYYTKRIAPGLLDALNRIGRRRRMKKKAAVRGMHSNAHSAAPESVPQGDSRREAA